MCVPVPLSGACPEACLSHHRTYPVIMYNVCVHVVGYILFMNESHAPAHELFIGNHTKFANDRATLFRGSANATDPSGTNMFAQMAGEIYSH